MHHQRRQLSQAAQRTHHGQYHGAGALSGLDEIEVYALKGERIDFTYSTAINRGAIKLELKEKQTYGRVRAGQSAWSSGYMEQSGSETAGVIANRMRVYDFVIQPASRGRSTKSGPVKCGAESDRSGRLAAR